MSGLRLLPCPFCGAQPHYNNKDIEYQFADFYHSNKCFLRAALNGHDTIGELMADCWNGRTFGQEVRLEGDTLYFEGLGTFKMVSE